jgi:DNA-directed RNA polymerase specialized sigma24 family protein
MTAAAEVFIALWAQGLTTAAIAELLGIPKGTVQSREFCRKFAFSRVLVAVSH